jgi:leader peptidase (prepilin peptidase)/N-methyltransferase
MDPLIGAVTTPFVLAFGAAVGSFINVVAYRLPAGLSLLNPPSRCPHCLHPLGKTENVPILGWLWLKGRCRWCQAPISIFYPLIETLTSGIFCLIFWYFGFHWETVAYWGFLSWLLALTLIDLNTMTLPNSLTQSGLILGLAWQIITGISNAQVTSYLIQAIAGAVVAIWFLDSIGWLGTFALGQPAMGGGDPKLGAMIGVWLGWKNVLLSIFLACLVGSIIGLGARLLKRLDKRQPIPFGPFLALGAALTIFWGDAIIASYLQLWF